MKNKFNIIKILIFLIIICNNCSLLLAEDILIDAEKVDIKERGNLITASGAVSINDSDFIEINGNAVNIPTDVGVTQECMYAIHTHSGDGKLHVEIPSSNPMKIKVSDFFTVWDKEFNENQLLDYTVDEDHEIVMTVFPTKEDYMNGTNGVISTDFGNHVFSSVDADGDGIADGDDTVVLIEYKSKEN